MIKILCASQFCLQF
uniref:Transmembrane protein 18 n=1 Tax=Triatoma infestans TaxID=30076 RepID=A0A170Y2Z5_TRIIF